MFIQVLFLIRFLGGHSGFGKSALMLQAASLYNQKDWIVFFMPSGMLSSYFPSLLN
jgi:predicted ATP-dependent serine protease